MEATGREEEEEEEEEMEVPEEEERRSPPAAAAPSPPKKAQEVESEFDSFEEAFANVSAAKLMQKEEPPSDDKWLRGIITSLWDAKQYAAEQQQQQGESVDVEDEEPPQMSLTEELVDWDALRTVRVGKVWLEPGRIYRAVVSRRGEEHVDRTGRWGDVAEFLGVSTHRAREVRDAFLKAKAKVIRRREKRSVAGEKRTADASSSSSSSSKKPRTATDSVTDVVENLEARSGRSRDDVMLALHLVTGDYDRALLYLLATPRAPVGFPLWTPEMDSFLLEHADRGDLAALSKLKSRFDLSEIEERLTYLRTLRSTLHATR